MTGDMAFECLFVSHDAEVFSMINRLLEEFSISTNLCLRASKASDQLKKGSTDLVVIDWEGDDSSDLVHEIRNSRGRKKPTILAITPSDCPVPRADVVLKKPVSTETATTSLKAAYSKMLINYRIHSRCALMMPVIASDHKGRTISLTVIDIGDGGLGLSSKEPLMIGDVLSFRLRLPGTLREILIESRVLWTREYARVGCEFTRIHPVDVMILRDWLKSKIKVKKPLV